MTDFTKTRPFGRLSVRCSIVDRWGILMPAMNYVLRLSRLLIKRWYRSNSILFQSPDEPRLSEARDVSTQQEFFACTFSRSSSIPPARRNSPAICLARANQSGGHISDSPCHLQDVDAHAIGSQISVIRRGTSISLAFSGGHPFSRHFKAGGGRFLTEERLLVLMARPHFAYEIFRRGHLQLYFRLPSTLVAPAPSDQAHLGAREMICA